jgi:chemotaxis protein CheC
MTQPLATPHGRTQPVDRACELASIGAGHAAGALAKLIGRPCEMRVPAARALAPDEVEAPFATDLGAPPGEWAGTSFELDGGASGVLAVFFPPAACAQLFATLLGERAASPAQRESALREVGNILASHALSAIGDTLRDVVLPSVPRLALRAAPAQLAHLLAAQGEGSAWLRVEVELRERSGALCGLLVHATPVGAREASSRTL